MKNNIVEIEKRHSVRFKRSRFAPDTVVFRSGDPNHGVDILYKEIFYRKINTNTDK